MITIDGANGEGGGQVLRTALALALATRTAFRIENIRARRERPGLMRQHLTAVHAAAAVGRARVEGDALGSRSLTFEPQAVEAGDYAWSVGTAGSATLVLQTVLLPLLLASGPTTLTIEGGTHNPWAPPFDFLERVFLRIVNRMGPRVAVKLERPGFYPAGGGRFTVTIEPAPALGRLEICERGEITSRRACAVVANLPRHIAERELATVVKALNWSPDAGAIEVVTAAGPGNIVFIEIDSEHVVEICTGFGESGTTAEAVAGQAARAARRYLASGVPVGDHLADQLLPVMALGEGGSFRTLALTQHARTNAEVIKRFLDVSIDVTEEARDNVRVNVTTAGC
jgi:RNA 3'-terminal phosphate cyclase (ATP)